MSITILVVDNLSVVRVGLRALIDRQDDMDVVAEAASGEAALVEYANLMPDVVVMDLKIPRGIDAVAELKNIDQNVKILIFSGVADESEVRDALDAGVSGYLLKDAEGGELLHAIRTVAGGGVWLHPQIQKQVLECLRRPPSPVTQLTARERSVYSLLAEGMSNKLIARKLDLTEGTVKGYVSQILGKLGVADRIQAALLARRLDFAVGGKAGAACLR